MMHKGQPGGFGVYRDGSNFRTASANKNSSFSHGVVGAVRIRETRTMRAPTTSRHHRPRIPSVGEFMRALRVLHRAYRDFPLRDRVHVDVRFLTSPFLPVVGFVPTGARVL